MFSRKSVSENFREVVQTGKLTGFRDGLELYLNEEFSRSQKSSVNHEFFMSAAQRVRDAVFSQRNIRAFVQMHAGNWFLFSLPLGAGVALGLSKSALLKSAFFFHISVLRIGFRHFGKALFFILKKPSNHLIDSVNDTVFIAGAQEHCLNTYPESSDAHNLENWLRLNFLNAHSCVFHSVAELKALDDGKRKYVNSFLPFMRFTRKFRVLVFACTDLIHAICLWFFGSWQYLYMIDDLIFYRIIKDAKPSELYDIYIFTFQGSQYRPYWTYEAERKNSKIVLLNYAANMTPSLSRCFVDRCGLKTATWNEIIPFSRPLGWLMRKEIRANRLRPRLFNGDYVLFKDNFKLKIPDSKEPKIALFDVPPLAESSHLGWTEMHDYMLGTNDDPIYFHKKFLIDVVAAAKLNGLKVCMKTKRADTRIVSEYLELLKNLEVNGDLLLIPPEVAPSRLIKKCVYSVSPPFSSTGYIVEAACRSCFYDVVDIFNGNHETAAGVDVISGTRNLHGWLANIPK